MKGSFSLLQNFIPICCRRVSKKVSVAVRPGTRTQDWEERGFEDQTHMLKLRDNTAATDELATKLSTTRAKKADRQPFASWWGAGKKEKKKKQATQIDLK
jgi:hypothetical protein